MTDVGRAYHAQYGVRPYFVNLGGKTVDGEDLLQVLSNSRRRRDYALQQSVDLINPPSSLHVPHEMCMDVAVV